MPRIPMSFDISQNLEIAVLQLRNGILLIETSWRWLNFFRNFQIQAGGRGLDNATM